MVGSGLRDARQLGQALSEPNSVNREMGRWFLKLMLTIVQIFLPIFAAIDSQEQEEASCFPQHDTYPLPENR